MAMLPFWNSVPRHSRCARTGGIPHCVQLMHHKHGRTSYHQHIQGFWNRSSLPASNKVFHRFSQNILPKSRRSRLRRKIRTESRQPSVQKVGRLMRKSSGPARVTALHLAKPYSRYQNLRATNHVQWQWHPVDPINQEALNSHVFHLSHDGVLTVNDTGLYFVYAQVTYSDQHPVNGFSIMVNNKRHASCSVHGQPGKKTNTCYTATLADLDHGSHIEIRDIDLDHVHLPYQEKTFFGLYKLGRRPMMAHTNT